jgi:PAS domain S-box-containing protein
MFQNIVPQSAGSLTVAVLGFLMVILQVFLRVKNPSFKWVGWSASISFSGMAYAVGIFLEYNTPSGGLNRFGGVLEFAALVFLIHSLYGLTFSYFNLDGKYYHVVAGIFHGLLMIVLLFTDFIVSRSFVSINFKWLSNPYHEPALGPWAPFFELYAVLSSIVALTFWFRYKGPDSGYRYVYIAGIGCWIAFGIHDGLASLGVPSVQYFMEYGYFAFSAAVFWVLFSSFADVSGEDKYRVITEFANDGIVVVQDDRIVFGNPAATRLAEKHIENNRVEELVGLLAREDRPGFHEHYRNLLDTGNFPDALIARFVSENGEERNVEVRASLIRYRNKPAVLGILRDVTEKIREEEALKESNEKILRLKKMESIGLLAGGVAHDLNNVLSGIINYPELILMNLPVESPLRKPIESIQKSGFKAVAIVQDLLTMARGVAIEKQAIDLNDVIREYLASPEYQKLLHFHPLLTVRKELESKLLRISGSAVHVGKVVMNLISNASEAIKEQGRILISTRNQYLECPVKGYEEVKSGEYAVLSVSDTGPGISPDDQKHIFEPFFSKKVMGRSGTGLGLTLVWNTMQDHGGYIDIISGDNGTTFELYFPVTREMPSKEAVGISMGELRGNGEKILVVDDMESQRDISCRMLEALNYRTESVAGGEETLRYLKTREVDLLLLDMVMDPGINGLETYRRALEIHPGQKAVIVSGFSKTDQVVEMQNLGAGRYLKKPVLLEELGAAVKEALGDCGREELNSGIQKRENVEIVKTAS